MGKKSKKSKNNIEPIVWDSLHDLELLLDTFKKYEFDEVLERSKLYNLYNDTSHEVVDSEEKYVKKVNLSNLLFYRVKLLNTTNNISFFTIFR